MNRIDKKFEELKAQNKKALITFVTAGDPDLDTTILLIKEMESQGADIIELGIPYSDPIAEGPVIQSANARALKNGIKIKNVMEAVKRARESVKVPLIYLLYFNCILQYGPECFFSDCKESGIDGVIIPDLPFEERDEVQGCADGCGIHLISLVSPTSRERMGKIAKNARGFLYCVSSLGVTGMRDRFETDFDDFFRTINKYAHLPKALGFGISTAEHIRELKGYCDGLIVGSAVVKQVERSRDAGEAVINVGNFVKTLRKAMDE
ncbi:MAG: tryptophan synthase subunit alpha [Clostridiales bacterium]|jgi:tryptophan synthase alpha chain|nr:tryptophan synthase subunit alpha [Eubacteriales bacterium]MDH7565282.1 tryptophan synthase subunit alpha [Clostridiales bacterium]